MKNAKLISAFSSFLLLILVSCGPQPVKTTDTLTLTETPVEEPEEVIKEDPNKWTYLAVLRPVNAQFSRDITGSVTLDLDDDRFLADVRVALAPANIIHFQSVHAGERCPGPEDDLNGDGVIDAEEGRAVWGDRLIPLDGNLNGQLAGLSTGPVADQWGNYIYVRMASFTRMLWDLRKDDERPEDDITKLAPDEPLWSNSRVAVIYGVPTSVELPETVASLWQWGRHQSLPIACGVFKRVLGPPGTAYDDDFLGEAPETGDDIPEILVQGSTGHR
jgi:hypothetical protein